MELLGKSNNPWIAWAIITIVIIFIPSAKQDPSKHLGALQALDEASSSNKSDDPIPAPDTSASIHQTPPSANTPLTYRIIDRALWVNFYQRICKIFTEYMPQKVLRRNHPRNLSLNKRSGQWKISTQTQRTSPTIYCRFLQRRIKWYILIKHV